MQTGKKREASMLMALTDVAIDKGLMTREEVRDCRLWLLSQIMGFDVEKDPRADDERVQKLVVNMLEDMPVAKGGSK